MPNDRLDDAPQSPEGEASTESAGSDWDSPRTASATASVENARSGDWVDKFYDGMEKTGDAVDRASDLAKYPLGKKLGVAIGGGSQVGKLLHNKLEDDADQRDHEQDENLSRETRDAIEQRRDEKALADEQKHSGNHRTKDD